MPFIYPSGYEEYIERILQGLESRGLEHAREYHRILIASLENSPFEEADVTLRALNRRGGWHHAVDRARHIQDKRIQLLVGAAIDNYPRGRQAIVVTVRDALQTINADRHVLLYMPVPLHFLAALELLFRASVMRYRMWNRAQFLSNQLLRQPFRLKDMDGAVQFSSDKPPVTSDSEIAIRPLVEFLVATLRDLSDQVKPKEPTDLNDASPQTIEAAQVLASRMVGAYV